MNKLLKKIIYILIIYILIFSLFNFIDYRNTSNITKIEGMNKPFYASNGDIWNFDYSGSGVEFVVPEDGIYKLEVWGASANDITRNDGSYNVSQKGGRGGYSSGNVELKAGDKLYIYCGGQGSIANIDSVNRSGIGGFNGGGVAAAIPGRGFTQFNYITSDGGGATHIATADGLLSYLVNKKDTVLIVAGGGGGAIIDGGSSVWNSKDGGAAGGTTALTIGIDTNPNYDFRAIGGNQTEGGMGASFGRGGDIFEYMADYTFTGTQLFPGGRRWLVWWRYSSAKR